MCSYLHQTFIAEPSLVKLVHFQGYPPELLPMMASGVPSMHICLDFIPELLGQPQTEKQVYNLSGNVGTSTYAVYVLVHSYMVFMQRASGIGIHYTAQPTV